MYISMTITFSDKVIVVYQVGLEDSGQMGSNTPIYMGCLKTKNMWIILLHITMFYNGSNV